MVEKSVSDYSSEHNIVPIVGSAGVREVQYQVNIIVSLLSHVLGGSAYFYNSAEANRKGFDKKYGALFGIWKDLDAVLFGLGPSPSKQSITFDLVSGKHMDDSDGIDAAVGDILGQFFTEDGTVNSYWEEGYLGLSIDQLKKVGRRICLCGGTDKVDSIITAAKLGYFNVLVTDASTAKEILSRKGELI
jgi:DNA-binding transcriptional regulator LsrR (DeoR family)